MFGRGRCFTLAAPAVGCGCTADPGSFQTPFATMPGLQRTTLFRDISDIV